MNMGESRPSALPKTLLIGKIDQTPSGQLPNQIRHFIRQEIF
jgi:hypothetical protein